MAPSPVRQAPNGMVCAVDHLAAEAGVAMMRAGGTAVDAAVATSAVLAVTTQYACGMGGDLFALVHHGAGPPACLNASGRAGSGADPDRLRAEGATAMPARGDIRSVPVPGCVDGWLALHDRFGALPLAEVLAPAVEYADGGFPASSLLVRALGMIEGVAGAEDYTGGGVRPGSVVRRPGVARALRDIASAGRDGFYGGEFGRGLLELGRGEYTEDDLARPQADWVDPIHVEAWGRRIWSVPPNSQGYVTLGAAWLAAQVGLPDDPEDPEWAHLLVEAARQASYDRPAVLHEGADGPSLVAPDRLAPRLAAIDRHRAGAAPAPHLTGGTIHLVAVDRQRMGVSLIQSNAAGWGSLMVVPGVRIFLQNRGIGFTLERGHPAEYGPGRRPPHTLAPALVTRDGDALEAVLGTEGGDTQPQVLLQLLARTLGAGEEPEDAMPAPRFVLQSRDTQERFGTWERGGDVVLRLEPTAPAAWAPGLRSRGHHVEEAETAWGFGHAQLIGVGGGGGVLTGASDPRFRTGSTVAY
jgi:gamma-glutamyltranspeptidase/glutathione hydrolase